MGDDRRPDAPQNHPVGVGYPDQGVHRDALPDEDRPGPDVHLGEVRLGPDEVRHHPGAERDARTHRRWRMGY